MNGDMRRRTAQVWLVIKTIGAVMLASFLWLWLLEELGYGRWPCL